MMVAIEMNRLTTRSSHSIFAMGMYCSDTSDSPGNTTQHHTHSGADEGEGNSFPARCASCFGRMVYPKRCSRCKKTRYCNGTCQRNHWRVHRDQCAKMKRDTDEKRQSCNGNDGSSFDGASNADDEGDDIQHLRVRSQQSSNLLPTPSLSSSTALPSLSVSSTTVMSSVSRKSSFTSKSIAGIPSLQLPVLRVAMWGGTVIPKMKKRATKYDQQPSKEEKRGIKARMNAQEQGRVMEQIRRRNDDLDGIDVDMDLDPHGSDLDLCSGDTYYDESDTESDSSNEEEEVEEEIDEEADEDGEPEVDIPSDMVYIDIDIGSIYGILSHSQKAMIKAFYKTHGKNLQSSRQHHQHAQQLRLNECRQHNLHPVSAREWRKCRINLIGTHREPWINFGVSAAVSLSPSLSTSSSAALSVSSPISSPLPTSSISSLSSASALPLCSSSLCPLSTLINDLNQIVQNLVVKSSIQKCVAQGLTSASRMPPSSSCNPKQMVTMMVEEGKYRISVHGSILKARSHHFKVLLSFLSQQQSLSSKVLKASRTRETASSLMMDSDGEKGNASKIVQLPDVSLGVMKSILNFVYTGSIDFTDLNMSILNLYNSNDGASDTQNTNNTTTHSSADTKARMSTNTAMCTNICGDISTLSSFDCRGQISPFDLMLVADRFQLKQLVELVQNYVIASIISSSSPPSLLSPPSSVSALAATSTSITVSSISTSTIHLLFSLLHFCDRFNVTDAFQSMRDRVMMYVLTHVMAPALAESSLFSMSPSSSTPVASTSISAPVLPSSSPLHAQITQEFGSLTESTRQEIIQKMKLLHLF